MTRNALLTACIVTALASGASPAAALTLYLAPTAFGAGHIQLPVQRVAAASLDGPGADVASLSEIANAEPTWRQDGDPSSFAGDVASGAASAAAQTDAWALVTEPAGWAYLTIGFGLFGARLRARRPLSTRA